MRVAPAVGAVARGVVADRDRAEIVIGADQAGRRAVAAGMAPAAAAAVVAVAGIAVVPVAVVRVVVVPVAVVRAVAAAAAAGMVVRVSRPGRQGRPAARGSLVLDPTASRWSTRAADAVAVAVGADRAAVPAAVRAARGARARR
jgi:hypothetical protein